MQRFRSRVSVLLLLVIVISVIPVLFFEAPIQNPQEKYLAFAVLGLTFGLVFVLLFTLRYEVGKDDLVIKVGPFSYGRIKLSDIQSVQRSYNPLSAPASSLKRLYINTKSTNALISPTNEAAFIQLLKARNPNIKVNITDKNDWWRVWNWDI